MMKPINKRLVELNAYINFIKDKVFFFSDSEQMELPEEWLNYFNTLYAELQIREQEARLIKNLMDHDKD